MWVLLACRIPVSYTHLDVYKRQNLYCQNGHIKMQKKSKIKQEGSSGVVVTTSLGIEFTDIQTQH